MKLLEETIAAITPAGQEPARQAAKQLASVLEGDEDSLGRFQDLLLRYIAIAADLHPAHPDKCTVICCASHGVAAEGVSAYPEETTLQMTQSYLIGQGAAANALADFADSEVFVADFGIRGDTSDIPGLIDCRVGNGTASIAQGPAMSREQAVTALENGIRLANKLIAEGFDCLLPGEMGIANTTISAAIVAALCDRSAADVTGRGTNISNERLAKKTAIVAQALTINQPDKHDGLDVLAKVGGFEFGAIAGLMLGFAAAHKAIILDGANCAAAALLACSLAPDCVDYLLPSQKSGEPSQAFALEKLGLAPFLHLDLSLGEACGSSILVKELTTVLDLWDVISHLPHDPVETPFQQAYMPNLAPKVTNKTFDFYLSTMQDLDLPAMNACRERIDHLVKPLNSLGALEQIAVEIAGITGDELPAADLDRALLCFTGKVTNPLQMQLIAASSQSAKADVTMAHVREGLPLTAAFDFGREQGEFLSLSYPLLGLAMTEIDEHAPFGTASELLRTELLHADGSLKYPADEFLTHAPEVAQPFIGAMIGAIIAAAHNSAFIILDDEASEIIARYTELLCPAVRPYILHVQPLLLRADCTLPGGLIAGMGMDIADASLYMLNHMRTFAESKVAVASDGPGAERQQR
ncbi:nicotinate-nucleotide--dimethylbenzimidazole phosphoribosyltransferase [Selenomonas ruminantium]|uniref:Nicotinate-nucleotide--dimethylbenzimidazole phosphoribosyltransferase n=1 Tax=Selenomonas ruminantium TaxID=971 RepID=A0A1M6SUG4_SELRU|nr:nicotinate-nucleotide--dimethylbenzimidazole phosphoribosyltransferase [Selenomonas ruminantium]SHK48335.1 nicotinate-nucleotide--dimethylbenzimidazole phosphoribosyltransferase [Selenomonas ruminantium]